MLTRRRTEDGRSDSRRQAKVSRLFRVMRSWAGPRDACSMPPRMDRSAKSGGQRKLRNSSAGRRRCRSMAFPQADNGMMRGQDGRRPSARPSRSTCGGVPPRATSLWQRLANHRSAFHPSEKEPQWERSGHDRRQKKLRTTEATDARDEDRKPSIRIHSPQ